MMAYRSRPGNARGGGQSWASCTSITSASLRTRSSRPRRCWETRSDWSSTCRGRSGRRASTSRQSRPTTTSSRSAPARPRSRCSSQTDGATSGTARLSCPAWAGPAPRLLRLRRRARGGGTVGRQRAAGSGHPSTARRPAQRRVLPSPQHRRDPHRVGARPCRTPRYAASAPVSVAVADCQALPSSWAGRRGPCRRHIRDDVTTPAGRPGCELRTRRGDQREDGGPCNRWCVRPVGVAGLGQAHSSEDDPSALHRRTFTDTSRAQHRHCHLNHS